MTIKALNDELETLTTTTLDGESVTHARLGESLTNDNRVADSECRWQVASVIARQVGDSNTSYFAAEARIRLHFSWVSEAEQEDWLEVKLDPILRALVPPSVWRALASVHDVTTNPEVTFPEAVGRVVTVEIVTLLTLT